MPEIHFHPGGLALEVRGLRVSLGGTPVLRGVDFHVPRGQVVALIGPNGSGKTTLLRCLLGLQTPEAGEIRIFGQRINPSVLRRLGYVPQRLSLDRSFILSVREFLCLKLPATRHWFWQSQRRTDQQLMESLPELELRPLLDRPVASLSGGQLQRVLIAHSLLGRPELLLLDEPTAGVDTPGENSFYQLITEIHRRHHLTKIFASSIPCSKDSRNICNTVFSCDNISFFVC